MGHLDSCQNWAKEIAEESLDSVKDAAVREIAEEGADNIKDAVTKEVIKEVKEETAEKAAKEITEEAVKHADDLVDEVAGVAAKEGSKTLTTAEAEEYAFNAIKGSNNEDYVVLGKYDALKDKSGNYILDVNGQKIPTENSYDVIAKEMDAQYFNLDNWDELSSQYSKEEIWKINERFLDIQTSSGREIYLVNDPKNFIGDGSYFSQEIQYLMDNGYRFVKEGDVWHAIR